MPIRSNLIGLAAIAAIGFASASAASVSRVSEANFVAGSGLITFDEFPLNTVNPTYTPGDYGGGVGSPTVTFDGYFLGQSLSATPGVDCPGAAATACVIGSPTGPLALDPNAPDTFITNDGAAPNSPVLSGTPRFNGAVAILFDTLQFGVGFDAGFFDAAGSTAITAYDVDGNVLGSVVNEGTGIEFLGLVSDSGADIAGVALELVGNEPAGFAIDSLRFGVEGQVMPDPIPLPASLPLLLAGFGGMAFLRKRARAA